MTAIQTNANSALVSALLADARVGTFTGLITTKKGKMAGRGADKKLYDNEQVHVVIFTGFRYERLVQRSLDALPGIPAQDMVDAAAKNGNVITVADVEEARAELAESFQKSVSGTNESSTDHVYDQLVVNGEVVRSGRVYKCVAETKDENGQDRICSCRDCTGDEKAPKTGTIYLQGLQVHKTVLTPAPNGSAPEPKSAPKTIAKNELRRLLPVSRYVSYALEPGQDWILNAGGTAAVEATKHGFMVTPEVDAVLSKAA